jgi:hypothetical protein
MNENISFLIKKYKNKGIVVDTNLLLLLAVGLYDPRRISSFKRTSKFNAQMFGLVKQIVEQFEQRYTTPYIITELDNLSRYLDQREWVAIAAVIRELLLPSVIELYTESSILLANENLHSAIGVTDSSISQIPQTLIFTDDLPFAARMQGMGRDVLNFSHLLL